MCYSLPRNCLAYRNMKRAIMGRIPTRDDLTAGQLVRLHAGRNWTKADIFLWEDASGLRLAVKDYANRPAWLRNSLGRLLIRHECAAYRRLAGMEGIPAFAGRVDAHAFAVAFVDGKDLSRIRRGDVSASFFSRLMDLLNRLHGAGVAHGDLHHRDVLVDSRGSPFLVDFSTAVLMEPVAGKVRRALFRAACGSDRRAGLKLKRRHDPRALTAEENQELDQVPAWYRIGKGLRWLLGRERRRWTGAP